MVQGTYVWRMSNYTGKKKRKADESGDSGMTKQYSREESIDEIVQSLRENMVKIIVDRNITCAWAQMKHNGQHTSLDHPHSIPFLMFVLQNLQNVGSH